MAAPPPSQMALALRRLQLLSDPLRSDRPQPVAGPGGALITTDAERDAPTPSGNPNGVTFLGCTGAVTEPDVRGVVDGFEAAGAQRFFWWISPCDQEQQIEDWVQEAGLRRFEGTGYPTLVRRAEPVAPHETDLVVRQIGTEEAEARSSELASVYGSDDVPLFFARSCSQSGVDGFIAEADGQIASAALLHLVDGVGYLGWMATAEAFRGRGGQNALIGARITRTAELGCEWVASETLYSLQGSLRNLQRNGFEIVYEKKVFEWRRTW